MKKTKHISLPYTYYPSKSPQIQQHLIYNVNYFQPNDEQCQTDMNNNNDLGLPVPDYVDENVSDKVVKLIQSYTGVVNKMVWRK